MSRSVIPVIFVLLAISIMIGCGAGGSGVGKVDKVVIDMENEFQRLRNKFIENGGIATIGQGSSERRNLAREKAITAALGLMAEAYEVKVERLRKSFEEEIGSSETELNETFLLVTKTVSSKVINGAMVRKTDYLIEDGKYTAYIVHVIDPKVLNVSILGEAQNHQQLYQRFRASEAFKELNEEVKKFEEFKKNQQF